MLPKSTQKTGEDDEEEYDEFENEEIEQNELAEETDDDATALRSPAHSPCARFAG